MFTIVLLGVCLLTSSAYGQSALENPQPNSNQSGISALTGWICNGQGPAIRFNGGAQVPVAYGTPRADTIPQCGDENNGFALLFNWNLLGAGTHLVELLNGGAVIAAANVTVATFGVEFLPGASGTLSGRIGGRQVTAVWSEAAQNLVITSVSGELSGDTGKWQTQRIQDPFLDFPGVELSLVSENGVAELVVECEAKFDDEAPLPGEITLAIEHDLEPTSENVIFQFGSDTALPLAGSISTSGTTLFFLPAESAPLVDLLQSHDTLTYQFTPAGLPLQDVVFDIRGFTTALNQAMQVQAFNEEISGDRAYSCQTLP